jgi:Tol biopolymer transport system component
MMDEQKQIPRVLMIGTIAIFVTMIVGTCMLLVFVFNLPLIFPPPGRTPQAMSLPTFELTLPPTTEPTLTITPTAPLITPPAPTPTLPLPTLPPPTLPVQMPSLQPSPTLQNTATPTLAPTLAPTPLPGRIIFVADRDGTSGIYIMRADGSAQQPLVPLQARARDYAPAISPDGSLVAFSSNRDRQDTDDIYVMRADGSNIKKITFARKAKNASSSWFPDNAHLAFISNKSGKWQVYTMENDGDNVKQVTKSDEDVRSVQVSPDGRRLAYTCGNEICLIDPDGSNQRVLLHNHRRKDQLAWSPDTTMIAYAQSNPGSEGTSVHIVDRSGHDREVVSDGAWPTWSPDGTRLVFASDMNGRPDLYVYNLSSGETRRLTNTSSADYSPVWINQ